MLEEQTVAAVQSSSSSSCPSTSSPLLVQIRSNCQSARIACLLLPGFTVSLSVPPCIINTDFLISGEEIKIGVGVCVCVCVCVCVLADKYLLSLQFCGGQFGSINLRVDG